MHLSPATSKSALNPKLAALCDQVDVSSIFRLAILRAKLAKSPDWILADLQRGLAASDRVKQHLYDELHIAAPTPAGGSNG